MEWVEVIVTPSGLFIPKLYQLVCKVSSEICVTPVVSIQANGIVRIPDPAHRLAAKSGIGSLIGMGPLFVAGVVLILVSVGLAISRQRVAMQVVDAEPTPVR